MHFDRIQRVGREYKHERFAAQDASGNLISPALTGLQVSAVEPDAAADLGIQVRSQPGDEFLVAME